MTSARNASSVPCEASAFRAILASHAARYPALQMQDYYKLVYQAAFGSEHAVTDADQARLWLEREVEGLGAGPEEPLVDPISGDGQIARVHLRPYVASGADIDLLLDAFIRTAKEFRGTGERLRRHWSYLERMAEEGALGVALEGLRAYFGEMETKGFPAVHHSEEYARSYRPAYRVVVQKYLHLRQRPIRGPRDDGAASDCS